MGRPRGGTNKKKSGKPVKGVGQKVRGAISPHFQIAHIRDPIGLGQLIEKALGADNVRNCNVGIVGRNFPLIANGCARGVKVRVERCLNLETSEQAALRLLARGFKLASLRDLIRFLLCHSDEVEKWALVSAVSEHSRLACSNFDDHIEEQIDGHLCVSYVQVFRSFRCLNLLDFRRRQLGKKCGILVYK